MLFSDFAKNAQKHPLPYECAERGEHVENQCSLKEYLLYSVSFRSILTPLYTQKKVMN